jgi:hypothetical protein
MVSILSDLYFGPALWIYTTVMDAVSSALSSSAAPWGTPLVIPIFSSHALSQVTSQLCALLSYVAGVHVST